MSATFFKDHFSGHASGYRAARPGYPPALFEWLARQAPDRRLAWDAGCGNGQASVALADHFARVVATDPSAAQIACAEPHPRIVYRVEPAEAPALADGSVSLVTVAQALHWFDCERFYAQARRVAAPGAAIAAWVYALCRIGDRIDAVIARLYGDILGVYWPPERRHTEDGYARLPFPFAPIAVPPFAMSATWTLPQFCAYLRTWSAAQRYIAANASDPVAAVEPELARAWGDPSLPRAVRWPLAVRAGRVN